MIRSKVGRYGLAIILVAVASAFTASWLRAGLEPPIAPFMICILLAGWLAGGGPAVLAAALSLAAYVALAPSQYVVANGLPTMRFVWVSAFAAVTAWYSAALQKTAQRLEEARNDLEVRVRERTAELRRSEELLLAAQRLSHTGSWVWTISTGRFLWSDESSRIFGHDMTGVTRTLLRQYWHPGDRDTVERELDDALRDHRPFDHFLRIVRPDGSARDIHCAGRPVSNDEGEVTEFFGVMMDITDLREAERAARRANQEATAARFAAVLDERTRLARELHDTLLQGFTGVSLKLVAVANRMTGPPETVAALRDVIAAAQSTLANARNAIWDMRPASLGGDDFAETLHAAVADVLRGTTVALDFSVCGTFTSADIEIETAVFRVATEAVTNVIKHAAARNVRVTLTYEPTDLRLVVVDDGKGFTVDPDFQSYGGHLGLLGMHERTTQARGRLAIRSSSDRGTEVDLRVPYSLHSAARFDVPAAGDG
jgi:PAS domain S-box-containing protein